MKRMVGGFKDEHGVFRASPRMADVPPPPSPPPTEIVPEPGSLDEIGETIILALSRAVRKLTQKIVGDDVSREVIGALKDCESMHRELYKREKEFLAGLSDEDLAKLANTPFNPHAKIV